MNNKVLACVDHSAHAEGVCDYAVWASRRLQAPLEFIHVLDNDHTAKRSDWSGSIGLGSQEALLEELTTLDAKRNSLRMERGRLLLEAAKNRAAGQLEYPVDVRFRNGELAASLSEIESEVRLFVIGKLGETSNDQSVHIGANLEQVVRSLHRPILAVPSKFTTPRKIMLAFDASMTTRKGVELVSSSPLFTGIECHVVMVGPSSPASEAQLSWATTILNAGAVPTTSHLIEGDADVSLLEHATKHSIDMIIMGAYGHSRIREFLVGSTTTTILRSSVVPVLLLR